MKRRIELRQLWPSLPHLMPVFLILAVARDCRARLCRWLDSQTWTASIFPLQCSTKRKSEIFTADYGKASRAK